jgi:hypothetical protein
MLRSQNCYSVHNKKIYALTTCLPLLTNLANSPQQLNRVCRYTDNFRFIINLFCMRKISIAAVGNLLMVYFSLSCGQPHHNTSLQVSESQHYFKLVAHFDKNKTKKVEMYMDKKIRGEGDMSFVNSRIDGKLALDDHTTFYIKKYPGYLEIKLDKEENPANSFKEIKGMAEGLKSIIQ